MTKINQLVVSKIQKRYIEIKNIGGSLMKLRNFLEKKCYQGSECNCIIVGCSNS